MENEARDVLVTRDDLTEIIAYRSRRAVVVDDCPDVVRSINSVQQPFNRDRRSVFNTKRGVGAGWREAKIVHEGTMRSSICTEVWQQIKAAYAAGIGLREIARKRMCPRETSLTFR